MKTKNKTNSYKNTTVNWGKSQADICKLLEKQGVQDIRFTCLQSRNELICEFNYPASISSKSVLLGVRICTPIPETKNPDQAKNQIHRALFYYLKTKFEALNFGLVVFMQEFMPHLIIYNNRESKTVYELFEPQYRQNILSEGQGDIKFLPGENR